MRMSLVNGRTALGARHHDACGLGFVGTTRGVASHGTIERALCALGRLEHRGACGMDGCADGAGISAQIPRGLLGDADAVGMLFLPRDEDDRQSAERIVEEELARTGFAVSGWRDVPCDDAALPASIAADRPVIRQVLAERGAEATDQRQNAGLDREAELYLTRRRCAKRFAAEIPGSTAYVCSLSGKTIVYKALCDASGLGRFYPDLTDPRFESAGAVFHRRFSTNTAPSWPLVQPLRLTAHNGEFNTLQGNVSWLRARGPGLGESVFGEHAPDLHPIVTPHDSDSVTFDRLFELLVRAGRRPESAMTMLCPEPYTHMPDMCPRVRAMCRYHSELIEPWDGPAAIVYFDGEKIGAGLDRNGLRPFRFEVTRDGWVIGGSETGLVDVPEREVVERGRLGPGHSICLNLSTGAIQTNDEIKLSLAQCHPYDEWVDAGMAERAVGVHDTDRVLTGPEEPALVPLQVAFGYAKEDIEKIISPMVAKRTPPIGSMGDDTPLAALSERPQQLYRFFKQRFAQVTNPPLDSIRERVNMSLETSLGRHVDVLGDGPDAVRCTRLDSPIISERDLIYLCSLAREAGKGEAVASIDCSTASDGGSLRDALDSIGEAAVSAVRSGVGLLVLTDRRVGEDRVGIPMLLAVASVHERLVREGLRLRCSLICDTGEAREDHHFACLIGFGATLVLPYLAFRTIRELAPEAEHESAAAAYREAVEAGLLKIMAKMGVTVIQSYRGAGLFEIVGLDPELAREVFPTAQAYPGRVGLDAIDRAQRARHAAAFGEADAPEKLTENGVYRFRRNGEVHARSPGVFKALHKAVRSGEDADYAAYTDAVASLPPIQPRDLLAWRAEGAAIELDEVEPIEAILTRLCVQAMSHGALSREAHELMAFSGNRIGVRTNSGEGGEAANRLVPYTLEGNPPPDFQENWRPRDGDSGGSAIKQIASGRFGVTAAYLASAREIEIKMAQGAKPGEGGQIPGFKVTAEIAAMRHTAPGTPLISPPPHHDIYSIEDLAELIYDLKAVNPDATVAVKLVASLGVGTIACGVAKAGADAIAISGADGGTGAAALSSIKHAGLPWEIGLSLTQRALAESGLRHLVRLRVDGGMATGRDIVTATMLGADEVGFGTTALIAAGCVMARRCHDNTCPVGIATQDPKLRAKLPGTPEHIVALFSFLSQEVRAHLASLGVRSLADLVGRVESLRDRDGVDRPLDTAELLAPPRSGSRSWGGRRNSVLGAGPDTNARLAEAAGPALRGERPIRFESAVTVVDRAIGATLAGRIARDALGVEGVNPRRCPAIIEACFAGHAGQSFGAYCTEPMGLELIGTAQDGVGKSMSGGEIVLRFDRPATRSKSGDPIAGNAALYGATGGAAFFGGTVGERFCVRNSGGVAVAEGCGDHGCEYMTGGRVVLLGRVGRNFASGMTGGVAWVLDESGYLDRHRTDAVVCAPVDPANADELRGLIESHAERTGSVTARELLRDWPAALPRFVEVCPASGEAATGRSDIRPEVVPSPVASGVSTAAGDT